MARVDAAELAAQYKKGLESFAALARSICREENAPCRIEAQFESLKDWSLFHSLSEIKEWFLESRQKCTMEVEEIPLNQVRGWRVDEKTGDIRHESGEFFVVRGVRITDAKTREVGGWDQPMIVQVGYDGGIVGILRKRFYDIPHYLIDAKAEPGNYEKLQLSPTHQATFSNLRRAHKGRRPHFADLFESPERFPVRILYKTWLAEDGGRLHLKRNLGMLVEVEPDLPVEVPEGFRWMSLYQLKECLKIDAWVNPHIRGIIAHL